jgi:hypothetical protein
VPLSWAEDFADALASTEIPVQEAALAALVWLDDPRPALPILLDHLDGDRARVAMYAMPRLARLIPRPQLVDALAQLLARPELKVTVHKEALRLLGKFATPRAIELLRASWSKPLHRDVRIAAMHAACSLLGQADAWSLLGEAARDPDQDVARALADVWPLAIAQTHRARYLACMSAVADHPSPLARAGLFGALVQGWSSVAPVETSELAARVLTRLDLDDPWREAARLLVLGGRSSAAHPHIRACVEQLLAARERDVAPAGQRDRLADRRLVDVVDRLVRERHPQVRPLLDQLATHLLAQPSSWSLGVRLRLAAASNDALAHACVALHATAPSVRQQLELERAAAAAAELDTREWTSALALAQVDALLAADHGLLALTLIASFAPGWGWGTAWTDRLGALREHPDLDTRQAARAVWIS